MLMVLLLVLLLVMTLVSGPTLLVMMQLLLFMLKETVHIEGAHRSTVSAAAAVAAIAFHGPHASPARTSCLHICALCTITATVSCGAIGAATVSASAVQVVVGVPIAVVIVCLALMTNSFAFLAPLRVQPALPVATCMRILALLVERARSCCNSTHSSSSAEPRSSSCPVWRQRPRRDRKLRRIESGSFSGVGASSARAH